MEPEWIFAIDESKLANPVYPKGLQALLIKISGHIYAIIDKCTHMACSLAAGNNRGFP